MWDRQSPSKDPGDPVSLSDVFRSLFEWWRELGNVMVCEFVFRWFFWEGGEMNDVGLVKVRGRRKKVKEKKEGSKKVRSILKIFLMTDSQKSPCIKLIKIKPQKKAFAM